MECSCWWDSCLSLAGLLQKAAQNLPVHQSIPTLAWIISLVFSVVLDPCYAPGYRNFYVCFFVLLRLRVLLFGEIKHYKSPIRIKIRIASCDHFYSPTGNQLSFFRTGVEYLLKFVTILPSVFMTILPGVSLKLVLHTFFIHAHRHLIFIKHSDMLGNISSSESTPRAMPSTKAEQIVCKIEIGF